MGEMISNPTLFSWPAGGLRGLAAVAAMLAFAAAGLALAPAQGSAAAPERFVGLQGWDTPTDDQQKKLRRARVQSYRIQLNWARVEKRRPVEGRLSCEPGETLSGSHCYDWGGYDRLFSRAAYRGIRMLPVVLGSPSWAYARETTPPLDPGPRAAYYAFAKAAAKRYGPNGTFWAGSGVPRATRAWYWQIWNEPNLPNYWSSRYGGPNPGQYARFLAGASDAANAGDSDVLIVVGGLPYSTIRGTIDPRKFLRGMMEAYPRIDRKFTAVGLHPYARTPSLVQEAVRVMRVEMNRIGYMGDNPLYITEMGWATGRPDGRFQVSESTQASYLRDIFGRLIGARSRYNIKGAFWFSLKDVRNADWWGERTGLLYSNCREKPSWTSLVGVTGGSTGPRIAC